MIDVLTQALTKILGAVIDSAATWTLDKLKARRGVARLLDLHEALLDLEAKSAALIADLEHFAAEPVQLKISLRSKLEPILTSANNLSKKVDALAPLLSVADDELMRKLIDVSHGKGRMVAYSLLPFCIPTQMTADGYLTSRVQYLEFLPDTDVLRPILGERLPNGLSAHGTKEDRKRVQALIDAIALRARVKTVDAFDRQALIAALQPAKERMAELRNLRKRFGEFISTNFSLKELLQ